MKKMVWFLTLNSLLLSFFAQGSEKPSKIGPILDQKLETLFPKAHVGLVIQDLKNNQLLYSKHADHYFTPASTQKLFTSYAALVYLGENFTYETKLKFDPKKINSKGYLNSDVVIAFDGDPSFTDQKLEQLLSTLKNKNIRKINGHIFIENHGYTLPHLSPGATWDTWSYYPPVSSVIVNENTVSVKLQPGAAIGEPSTVALIESDSQYTLTHRIQTVSEKEAEQNCSLEVTVDPKNNIDLSGCWPIRSSDNNLTISLASPEHAVKQKIQAWLKKWDIDYPNQTIYLTENSPISPHVGLQSMAAVSSLPLSELIKPLLQDSNNIYSDSLHKKLGQTYFGIGSYAHGVQAQQAILAKLGVPLDLHQQFDGSGASRYNLMAPNQLVRLLTRLYQDKAIYQIMSNALPISGTAGTLKNRFQSDQTRICQNKIHAKTGSLKYISALAGYLDVTPEKQYAFALMIQWEPSKGKLIKQKEDRLLAEIYRLLS